MKRALPLVILAGLAGAATAQPLGTAFTYQGRLTDAGNPASGAYDLQLALFDAATGSAQVGSTLTRDDVAITEGLFTVSLDFGSVFAGSKRWIELRVRPGASTGTYTTLLPRQELTPGPNAVFSATVPWSGVSNKPAGFADDVDNDSGGTVTSVTAGAGLTGGTVTTAGTFAVAFGGAGSVDLASRTDHDHLAQTWTGSAFRGLDVRTLGVDGTGLFGQSTLSVGAGTGVSGVADATSGTGVSGLATAASGPSRGVVGSSSSSQGVGVFGTAIPTAGSGVGVYGRSAAAGGFAGFFENTSGGPAIGLSPGGIRFADGSTQTTASLGGDITSVAAGSGLTGGGTSGAVTLNVDPVQIQARVTGTCPPGQSIRTILADGSVTCQADTTGADWTLAGNAGTNPAENFIGTTDAQPFELRASNMRVLRVEPRSPIAVSGPNVLLGYEGNLIAPGVQGSTVAGGGLVNSQDWSNRVTGTFAVVGGGVRNRAGGPDGSVPLSFTYGTVGGGEGNNASGFAAATIGGGRLNVASGNYTTVAGGESNVASALWATVPGGIGNVAGGEASFAGGSGGHVRNAAESGDFNGDEGTFLWAGRVFGSWTSTGPNQFLVRAPGGVGINTNAPVPGALTVAPPGKLTFGAQTRQMIDLWGAGQYGIGVQGGTVYFRTEPPGGAYAWFLGGSHSDVQYDPGPGGVRQMRLDGAGNLFVRGSVNPGGADFAEMLPAEPGLEAGDVLVIGADGRLTLSTKPYEDTLAGVYSTKPGLLGGAGDGESLEGKVPLAVAGVVPVKVTAENGPVKPGDLLTSSSTSGHAMRASRERVAVGVVIGKALEPLDSTTGVIRALVVLQ